MRKKRTNPVHKMRTAIVATVLCLVSAVAMAGVYRLEKLRSAKEEPLVNWEETAQLQEDGLRATNSPTTWNKTREDGNNKKGDSSSASQTENEANADPNQADIDTAQNVSDSDQTQAQTNNIEEEAAQAAVNNAVALNFSKDDKILWPIEGNVILDYSMNASIYFPTLKQYKYNPAIIIQGDAGMEVVAAAAGRVDTIERTDETGLTLTIDLGNNFKAVYGQLEGVNLSTGAYVERGQIIGTIASPTKYYSVEGYNLYFQLLENGKPIDPLDYME